MQVSNRTSVTAESPIFPTFKDRGETAQSQRAWLAAAAVSERKAKRRKLGGGFAAVSALVIGVLAPSVAHAATLYWDGGVVNIGTNGDGLSGGTAGTWDTTITNWDQGSGLAHVAWSGTTNTAVFGGTAGTVTVGADVTVGGLQFNTTGYTLASDTGTRTLNFASGDNTILFNNIAAASTTLGATAGLKLSGSGNVILSASNPATAGTLTLQYAVAGDFSTGWSGTTTINPAMTLALNGRDLSLSNTSGITLNGGGITLTNTNSTQGAFDRVNNSAGITSNGGTITYTNNSGSTYAEVLGSVALTTGQLNIAETTNMATGSQTLTLSGLTHTGASNTSAVSFGSASGLNITTNMIKVTGASGTGQNSGQIIGPWASYGTTPASPTDYAVYDSNGFVRNANITATAENSGSWVGGANVTLNAPTTLTATRTVNSLRYTGIAGSLALAANNLETYGVLNGGAGLTISGTGTLTTPSGGGNLFLTAGAAAITVSAPINDNGGAVTVVKSGSNTLTLSSTTSNYSGGTVINSGTLATSANSNLGSGGGVTVNGIATWNMTTGTADTYNRTLTINDGAVLSFASGNGAKTISGIVSGNGGLVWSVTTDLLLSNTGNTFNGPVTVTTGGTNPYGFSPSSLGDAAGAGLINLGGAASTGYFWWKGGATTFTNRQFALSGTTGGGSLGNIGSGALVINKDLVINGIGNKTLTLTGTNTGINTFAGNIANGTDGSGSVIGVTKDGLGTWALGGTNSYSGNTNLAAASGTLIFQGSQSLSANTKLVFAQNSSSVHSVRLLDDGVGTISFNRPIDFGGSNTSQSLNIAVGNNNTNNGGSSSGTTTGSTIQVGDITFTSTAADTASTTINATSPNSNNYRLQTGTITLNNLVTRTAGATTVTVLNPTTANMTVAAITMATGNAGIANDGVPVLRLDGTSTDNIVTGNVTNASDYLTGQALSLQKQGTGNWALNGTGNNFTGAITFTATTTSGGTLSYASAAGTNPISFAATTGFGSLLSYTGASPLTMSGLVSATALTTGGITIEANGTSPTATINYSNTSSFSTASASTSTRFITFGGSNTGDNTFAGAVNNNTGAGGNTQVAKTGAGKWVLTGNGNYSGGLFVNNGTISTGFIPNGGVNSPLGANTRINLGRDNNDGILIYTGAGDSTNRDVRIGGPLTGTGTGGSSILNEGTGALTFTAATFNPSQASIAFNRTLTLGGSATGFINEVQGVIQNNTASTGLVNLAKSGDSTWKLSGTNTYTGTTTVNGGTLLVNGNNSAATGAVTVATTATLGGSGTIGGAVTVSSGGTLAPGNSPGQLTVDSLTLNSGSTTNMELAGFTTVGTDYDNVKVTGATLSYGGTLNVVNFGGYDMTLADHVYDLFDIGSATLSTDFSSVVVNGLGLTNSGGLWTGTSGAVSYSFAQTSGDLTIAVPEPSTAGLLGLGGLLMLRRKRKAVTKLVHAE